MFDFRFKKLDNIQFSIDELLNYYNEVETNFQKLKWINPERGVYGWSIQSKFLEDRPCCPYDWGEGKKLSDQPTKLIFGFTYKILKIFSFSTNLAIAGLIPNNKSSLHKDDDIEPYGEQAITLHIPIKTNNNALFVVDDTAMNLELGSIYLVNTILPHYIENSGTEDRIHMFFKIPVSKVDLVLSTEYVL